jgi:hypothetical protein
MRSMRIWPTAAAVLLPLVAAGCAASAPPIGAPSAAGSPTAAASGSTHHGIPVQRVRPAADFEQLGFSGFLVADGAHDRLWSGSQTSLGWIDARTGATHTVDRVPGVYLAVYGDVLYRTAWAHDNVARYAVGGTTREAARRSAPSPLNIAAGPGGVWASDHNHGYLLRLDPQTLAVVKRVRIGAGEGVGPAGLLWQGRNLLVNVKRDSTVALVDGRTGAVLRRVMLDGVDIGDDMSLTSAGLWAEVSQTDDTTGWRLLDPRTLRVTARVDVGFRTTATPVEVDGQIWLPADNELLHLDPAHGWQPDRAVDLGVGDLHPRFATVGLGSLWISSLDPARIVRVDLSDLR